MFKVLLSLVTPFDRFCANIVLNMLGGLWINPAALPPSVLGYLHSVVATSRIGRGRLAARLHAIEVADFAVSQLALWLDLAYGPLPGSFRNVDPAFSEVFGEAISQADREVIQAARAAIVGQELLIKRRIG